MTFDEALSRITDQFKMAETDDSPSRHIIVCSGGSIAKADDPVPGLYATRELAIEAWCDSMLTALFDIKDIKSFTFTDGPHCDKHLMTNQTQRMLQRNVEDRFSVSATVGIFTTTTA